MASSPKQPSAREQKQARAKQSEQFRQARERAIARAKQRQEGQSEPAPEQPAPAAPAAIPKLPQLQQLPSPATLLRRPPLIMALVAGVAWASAILLLLGGSLSPLSPVNDRLLYALLLLVSGIITFLPLQWSLELPALAWRGTAGWSMLFYTLAFVPAPHAWLMDLPELPVYLIFMLAVFLAFNAAAMPAIYAIRQRVIRNRPARFDINAVHRQATEIGLVAAGSVGLAALGILTPISLLLLIVILMMIEFVLMGGRT